MRPRPRPRPRPLPRTAAWDDAGLNSGPMFLTLGAKFADVVGVGTTATEAEVTVTEEVTAVAVDAVTAVVVAVVVDGCLNW